MKESQETKAYRQALRRGENFAPKCRVCGLRLCVCQRNLKEFSE